MRGWVRVTPEGLRSTGDLTGWVAEVLVDRLDDYRLEGARPSIADGLGEPCWVAAVAEGGEEDQVGHLEAAFGVVGDRPLGVGLGRADEPGSVVLAGPKLNCVAPALGHLGAVEAEQDRRGGQEGVGLVEDVALPA